MDTVSLLDRVEGYFGRWKTWPGFVFFAILTASTTFTVSRWLDVGKAWTTGISAVAVVVWFAIWLFGSCRWVVPRMVETVVVTIKVDIEGQRQFDRIANSLAAAVAALRLPNPVRLLVGAPGILRNELSAERYLNRFGLLMVVWGTSEFGRIEGERLLSFDVRYTTSIVNPDENLQQVKSDIQLLNEGRTWTIKEVNDLVDTKAIAEGLLELTLALIGINYYLRGRFADGVVVFRRVLTGELARGGGVENPCVRRYRALLHAGMAREAFLAHDHRDYPRAVELLRELRPFYPNNIPLLMTLARASYYAGDEQAAIQHTMEIASIDMNHPAVPANRAFFAIKRRNYLEVRRWYDRLIAASPEKYDLLPAVSEFLEQRYDEEPDEHAYLYGMAIVNGLSDRAVLRSDLLDFLDRTADDARYNALRKRAAQLLHRNRG